MSEEANREVHGIFKGPFRIEDSTQREWLETNEAGAYCCSTIIERHDRKYHGLLVSPAPGFEGRYHILSAVDAVFHADSDIMLGNAVYPGAFYPEGWKALEEVKLLPWPAWVYSQDGIRIRKEVFMKKGDSAVFIVFRLIEGPDELEADLKFLFTFRNIHELTRENSVINHDIIEYENGFRVLPYAGMPAADIVFSGEWKHEGSIYWDSNINYHTERLRGHEYEEDRFVPGMVFIRVRKNEPYIIRVGIDAKTPSAGRLLDYYAVIRGEREKGSSGVNELFSLLGYQANHFLIENSDGKKSINAGYPWFGEWSRDTMISLPGLSCYNGKTEWCVDVLNSYISLIKDGMLPNTIGATQGFTSYNSIDAGLLFSRTVMHLIRSGYGGKGREKDFLTAKILPALEKIADAFIEGNVPELRIISNGLISSGNPYTQLTWMDATAWGKPVTSRHGFAVDLNALWFDTLKLIERLSAAAGKKVPERITEILEGFPEAFQAMFWLDDKKYLTDTVNENGPDYRIRPNMLFASSAHPGLLTDEQIKAVVETAEKHLLTPMGLRTLSPDDPFFAPEYSGGPNERDSRYHQGTVWPWILGIMIESSLSISENIIETAEKWNAYLENFLGKHLCSDGWGFVSEIFDGMNPLKGKGSFAQAWSSAEIIRAKALIDDILRK